jgi:hypothetical protein
VLAQESARFSEGHYVKRFYLALPKQNLPIDETPQRDVKDNFGSANGIRTRVTAVRGRCPRPLDDSAEELYVRT